MAQIRANEVETPVGATAAVHMRERVRTRVSGAAVWTGFAVGMAVWLLLELLLFAVDLTGVDFGVGDATGSSWFWNGIAAVVAFLIGGFVAGYANSSGSAMTATVTGAAVWAIGVIATVVLSGLVGGFSFGAFGDVIGFGQAVQDAGPGGARIGESTVDSFREGAGWATVFLAVTLVGSIIGAMGGAKAGAKKDDAVVDVR